MTKEIDPKSLEWPISPCFIVDDCVAGIVHIHLSPEVPLQSIQLSDCFEDVPFKGDSKAEWARVLRDIADKLDRQS